MTDIPLATQVQELLAKQRKDYTQSITYTPLNSINKTAESSQTAGAEVITHVLDDGSQVFQMKLEPNTPSEFSIYTSDGGESFALLNCVKNTPDKDWQLRDVVINSDLHPDNNFLRVGKIGDLDKGLANLLPGVDIQDGIELRIDQVQKAGQHYLVFFARVYDSTSASQSSKLKSVYFSISRDQKIKVVTKSSD